MIVGGSPARNARPLAAYMGLDSAVTAPLFDGMSASRELQRHLLRQLTHSVISKTK
jgi:hypothetical protein